MVHVIAAIRLATLVGEYDRSPAYLGLAARIRELVTDRRIPLGARLPSERDLTRALGVSRTTVTRAYEELRETGHAVARRGSGTFTASPSAGARVHDQALHPYVGDEDLVDLSCAASGAPAGIGAAYADALAHLPRYLDAHGYYLSGLPDLQDRIASRYRAAGVPTTAEQIMVTPGALTACSIIAQAFSGPGDRVLTESPVYPNATTAMRHSSARVVGTQVDPDGWDLDAMIADVHQVRPLLAYLIPDFQNPTGHLMTDEQRERLATVLAETRTIAVVDEAHRDLDLAESGTPMPAPFAAYGDRVLTIGSASKTFWGGLRLGWIRASHEHVQRLLNARVGLDLGAPVLEQLVLHQLLEDPKAVLDQRIEQLRGQRDTLVSELRSRLPQWRFHVPRGGLSLWCELPTRSATALAAEAERAGVLVSPGPMFGVDGGLDQYVRLPWARPNDELEDAVARLATAWEIVTTTSSSPTPRNRRLVA